ncbi:PREDICTED: protein HEG homolog 1-like [Pygoscelis adeliae]|uniref:protein HEG homolog 1-like n=1 Tax=Pygoscelis adeliae TaxID=9238 RepID=UPI0004F4DF9F|nr:PREDICTED: protein HEG homolog 1-like [Pygoscelis adeliae]
MSVSGAVMLVYHLSLIYRNTLDVLKPTGLRNPELERNGLYPPYTGLPGSRHSCIYPGQYNPSFISDETRRRDYF